jgi:hypothetical protein
MNTFNDILVDLNQRIVDFENSITERSKELENVLNNALEFIEKFEVSWSGYWLKSYADLYFSNLQKPPSDALFDPQHARIFGIPSGWIRISSSEVEKIVEECCKLDIYQIREEIFDKAKQATEIYDDLCVELSLIKTHEKFTNEVKELEKLEKIEWGISNSKFINYKQPKSFVGSLTDFQIGLEVPPHIQVQASIVHILTKNSSVLEFVNISKKLIRKIQIKENIFREKPITVSGIENIVKICNSFHVVARQLRQRHSNRATLAIEDEYDVQDLFHALLRLFFEDVRAEEWTPSYAGGSSRVDFLLPQEKIVVELKKTRNGLGEKEVGSHLLIDIVRYQSHPDCKNLICFVYDPEGRIGNPKGLENDLNNLSSERINIITLIRPN